MSEVRTVIAFLTGQSDPRGNALSAAQRHFLQSLAIHDADVIEMNFPYGSLKGSGRKIPLWRASLSNAWQYLGSRRNRFAERHRAGILEQFRDYDQVIFLAGSCGLELLVNLKLPDEFLRKTHVFAYGPVSRAVPNCATLWRIQGSCDFISRHWHFQPDRIINCHHMNYLEVPETRALFLEFYQLVKGH